VTRAARILPGRRCGYPESCAVKSIDHEPEPGMRRIWTYHDVQCQVPNPQPGPHLDGYPGCGFINGHEPPHDYRRDAAEPEPEAEAGP